VNRKPRLLLLVAVVLSLAVPAAQPSGSARAAETRDLVVLGTSDIHGNVDNYDYFTDSVPTGSSQRGLTKILTYANAVRAANPNTILIDNGDTIQGTPLAYYFNVEDTSVTNPMAAAMNYMDYAAATVGNHEFNYGPAVLNKYQDEADYPLLSANVTGCTDYTFQPYVIEDVGGVQIGILGLTPPAVVHWERPENITGCVFGDAMAAANTYVPQMRAEGADIIVVAAHTGLDETYGYGRDENFVKYLANEVPGIDVILAGHAHALVGSQTINGVLVTEPNYHGRNVSDVRISVTGSGSDWTVATKSATAPALGATAEDAGLKTLMQPYHDAAVSYINTPIGTSTGDFPGGFAARVADGPMADLINQVQTEAAAEAGFPVEASLAALFTNQAQLTAGPIKLKDAYAVYIYDNTLYVIEATGQMIKDELEWTAGYFNQYFYEPSGVTVNSAVRDYNYDLWSGIDYKLDVTKPVGQRVVELELNGQPLAMDEVVRVALNNYRATGRFPTAPKLYQSTTEVRELITDWIVERGTISPEDVYDHNFDLLPPVATWSAASADDPVTRADNADLLWTAFGQSSAEYMKFPNEKKAADAASVTREGEFFLLGTRAMGDLREIGTDMSVLAQFSDAANLASWAKASAAYLLWAGVVVPEGDQLLADQPVTNAEALAWVREARYPLFTFLSTNDFHGQLETGKTVTVGGVKKPVGGAAFNMSYIDQYRALNPLGTSLYDAGDIMQGTPISNLLQGASVIDVYNTMGYQAATAGNHEFDWGQDMLQERIAQADFPFLLANVFYAGTDARPAWLTPTAMFTVKGQQVGVIGVTSEYTPTIVMAGNLAGLEFRPVGPIVSQFVDELRAAGADLVVVLAHMPGSASGGELASVAVPGVDLVIAGHAHSGFTGTASGIPVIEQYSSGTALGVSNLRYDRLNRSVASSALQVVTTFNEGVTPDPEIAAIVADYQAQIAPIVSAVKASTLGPISRSANAAGESPMGNLIADAQRWKAGTQIAFTNPGGIRAAIEYGSYPHDITYGDFLTVQPFDNKLATMTLTGTQLYAVLEQQFAVSRILQVSGIRYSYNTALPAGSRIVTLTLADGTPIASDATPYTVAMNEFIATGGDGFTTFLAGTNLTYIGISDLDALIDFVQFKYGTPPTSTPVDPAVYPVIDGRITKL
jgi:2',3'-cyclic-nucleotide 2'-phosphodiesterase/3'-nucleotidase